MRKLIKPFAAIGALLALLLLSGAVINPQGVTVFNMLYRGRSVASKLGDTVSVKDFGAVGDGVTDDASAINSAISSGATTVLVPAGTYVIASQINMKTGVVLAGAGMGATTIQVKAGVISRAVVAQNINDWTVRDLTIDTNKANVSDGLSDTGQQAIYALATLSAGILRGRIERVHAMNGWRMGFSLQSNDTASPGTWPMYIDVVSCRIEGYSYGILATKATGARVIDTESSGNVNYGINFIRSKKWMVRGSDAHDNTSNGIVANTDCQDFHIDSSRATGNGGIGIVVSVNAQRFVVANNRSDANNDNGISVDVKKLDATVASGSLVRSGTTVTGTVANQFAAGDTVYLKAHADSANFPVGTKTVVTATASNFTYTEAGGAVSSANSTTFINTTQVPTDGVVSGNVITNSVTNHGIYAQFLTGLTISGNTAFGNAQSGIYVTAASNVTVTGNTARNNTHHGIGLSEATVASQGYVAATGNVTVTGNLTLGNTAGEVMQDATLTGGTVFLDVFASAVPATGTWNTGIRVWNSAPAAGAAMGWVRVVTGSANVLGTDWKAMPNL